MGKYEGMTIDAHVHVGVTGRSWPALGWMSDHFMDSVAFRVFLLYARLRAGKPSDQALREATEKLIGESGLDHVVCLALDRPHTPEGEPEKEKRTHLWVPFEYVLELRRSIGEKVLPGTSVHPYRKDFETRTRADVERGAVVMKWLPSAQRIDLADPRAADAMKALARLGPGGRPLPLLLHTGAEYAVLPADDREKSFDFLSWSRWDAALNGLRFRKRWRTPRIEEVRANLIAAVDGGARIILAHCGLPYFASGPLGRYLEHSDFEAVADLLRRPRPNAAGGGFYADVSALCTPFRKPYFDAVRRLPPDALIFGSDAPTPIFELDRDASELKRDFRAVMAGQFDRIVVPQDNLLDVNRRELARAFGADHPMFTNLGRLLG